MKTGRLITGGAVIVAVALSVSWLSGWFEQKIEPGRLATEQQKLRAEAETVKVALVLDAVVEWASGTIESAHRTTISSRILARITDVRVAAGDEVASGDLLVSLDARDLEARLQQAREALNAAQAQRELAQVELGRAEDLLKRGVATRQRFDQATTDLQVASANVERLTRSLEEAETTVSYTQIRAPTAGRVIDRLAQAGDTVAPGQALLRLYDPTTLRVEAPVRESLAISLKVGDRLDVEISAFGQTVPGIIEEIVPYSEPGARALLVKTRLPDDRRLFAGIFARIAIPTGKKARLVIPGAAVTRIGQLEFVTVVAGNTASRRMVTTGERLGDERVVVLSGLKAGESIVAATD